MPTIDQAGVYRGPIDEITVNTTKKGYPQAVARFKANERYVETEELMKHFNLEQPGWVDWSSYGEDIIGYLVLFNDADRFDDDSKLMNYEQLQLALGWDGLSFESLTDDTYVGKQVLFRVDEDEYQGNVKLRVNWVDEYDAPPQRELKKLDADKLKDLSSKLKIKGASKPAVAKPGAKPAAPAAKPAAKPAATPTQTSPPPAPPSPPASEPESETTEAEAPSSGLPAESDKLSVWNYLFEIRDDQSDQDVTDAFTAACHSVGGDKDEDAFTGTDWAEVRDTVISDLGLNVK